MIITRESDYAVRILRALADGEQRSMRDMCETEEIPLQFGYKIIEKLQRAGYVVCTRGRNGGCTINCDLHDVSVFDLLHVIDNDCYVNACLTPGFECEWKKTHPEGCKVHMKLGSLQNALNEQFKDLSLYALMFE